MGFIKNLFKGKGKDNVKLIFNMPREEFRKMLEEEIIPRKTFSLAFGKEEVLKLMEIENVCELNYGDCDEEIKNTQGLGGLKWK